MAMTTDLVADLRRLNGRIANRLRRLAIDPFHRLYYESTDRTWSAGAATWLGHETLKCPLDLWIYQQLLISTRPDLIIETGTYAGGSALWFASVFDLLATDSRIVTIDVEARPDRPTHPRIDYVLGSSTDPEVVGPVLDGIAAEARVMVVLDSDHSRDHVRRELELYAPHVSVGCYLIVEDTNLNGNPVAPNFGPGPAEAVAEFLTGHSDFIVDRACERFLLTFNPGGYLRRVAPTAGAA